MRFLSLVILGLIIILGILVADTDIIVKDSILPSSYVVRCFDPGTNLKIGGHVENTGDMISLKGWDDYLIYINGSELEVGDEIVVSGYYNGEIFVTKKLYKYDMVTKNRYISSFIMLPLIILIFFIEYKFKKFKFVKRKWNG